MAQPLSRGDAGRQLSKPKLLNSGAEGAKSHGGKVSREPSERVWIQGGSENGSPRALLRFGGSDSRVPFSLRSVGSEVSHQRLREVRVRRRRLKPGRVAIVGIVGRRNSCCMCCCLDRRRTSVRCTGRWAVLGPRPKHLIGSKGPGPLNVVHPGTSVVRTIAGVGKARRKNEPRRTADVET